jgi:hypothetical protein
VLLNNNLIYILVISNKKISSVSTFLSVDINLFRSTVGGLKFAGVKMIMWCFLCSKPATQDNGSEFETIALHTSIAYRHYRAERYIVVL